MHTTGGSRNSLHPIILSLALFGAASAQAQPPRGEPSPSPSPAPTPVQFSAQTLAECRQLEQP
jgi:hypothetical protein